MDVQRLDQLGQAPAIACQQVFVSHLHDLPRKRHEAHYSEGFPIRPATHADVDQVGVAAGPQHQYALAEGLEMQQVLHRESNPQDRQEAQHQ